MLDVCLLGTGGMMPLPGRWLTALTLKYNGSQLLIDCGEGTQVAMKKAGISSKPVDIICFTHYHADHISGLPGFLLSMGNAERTEPLTIIGPKGVERVVNSLRVIAPELPFEINFIELTQPEEEIRINGYVINAYRVNHSILCYGYSVSIERAGKFDAARAKELGIPVNQWNVLQKGSTIELDGRTYTPDMVMGEKRKGIKVTYVTDTRPLPTLAEQAKDADLFICEGMYGEPDKLAKAKEYKHMTFSEAASLAKEAQPKEMWLTHYSPSLAHPEEYIEETRKIFSRTIAAKDGRSISLDFEQEEGTK
mgnify:CR=1 FL=1